MYVVNKTDKCILYPNKYLMDKSWTFKDGKSFMLDLAKYTENRTLKFQMGHFWRLVGSVWLKLTS